MKKNLSLIFLVSSLFLFGGCEAERLNPLDPLNTSSTVYEISGSIKTASFPQNPIGNVFVTFSEGSMSSMTDSDGGFIIRLSNPRNGYIRFSRDGFKSDSAFVDWRGMRKVIINKTLSFSPVVTQFSVRSEVTNRFPSVKFVNIRFEADITDQGSTVDSVFASDIESGKLYYLTFDRNSGLYTSVFSILDFPGITSFRDLTGKEFSILIKEKSGHITVRGLASVKRIIEDEPLLTSPVNGQNLNPQAPIEFKWQLFNPGFGHSFIIEIYSDDINPFLIRRITGIASGVQIYSADINLPAGDYFWVLFAEDKFGNLARSKTASFRIN